MPIARRCLPSSARSSWSRSPRSRAPGITQSVPLSPSYATGLAASTAHDLPFQDGDDRRGRAAPYRRPLIEQPELYRAQRPRRLLPLGVLEPLALPGQSYKLAFTRGPDRRSVRRASVRKPTMLERPVARGATGRGVAAAVRPGLCTRRMSDDDPPSNWRTARRHFFRRTGLPRPFGNFHALAYDRHDLLAAQTRDR